MNRFELHVDDPDYPALLRAIPDPPELLFGVGDPAHLAPGVAIIGARKATPYGTRCARSFARWAARAGVPVVSGAALGCDHAAHDGALEVGGATVAVLGCGADLDYPARSACLLERIRAEGAVISELPWGTQPKRWTFARRNRIIAGLSKAVLVVEAALPSGTFSTADEALSAGRDVMAVPGSVFAHSSRGANRLIRQGATPITDICDFSQELQSYFACLEGQLFETESCATVAVDPILEAARANPARPDDLARDLELSITQVARALSRHERSGALVKYRDGRYGPG
jgi:DNA processing protein